MFTQKFSDETLALTSDVFASSEPLSTMTGTSKEDITELFKFSWAAFLNHGLSVVATDDQSGSVVGAFLGLEESTLFSLSYIMKHPSLIDLLKVVYKNRNK